MWAYWFIAALLPASSTALQLRWPWLGYLAPREVPGALCCLLAGPGQRRQLAKILRRRQEASCRPALARPAPLRSPGDQFPRHAPPLEPTRLLRVPGPVTAALLDAGPDVRPDGSFPVAGRRDLEAVRSLLVIGQLSREEARERIARLERIYGA